MATERKTFTVRMDPIDEDRLNFVMRAQAIRSKNSAFLHALAELARKLGYKEPAQDSVTAEGKG